MRVLHLHLSVLSGFLTLGVFLCSCATLPAMVSSSVDSDLTEHEMESEEVLAEVPPESSGAIQEPVKIADDVQPVKIADDVQSARIAGGVQPVRREAPREQPRPVEAPPKTVPQETPPASVQPPEYLMGEGQIAASDMKSFILGANSRLDPVYIEDLIFFYIEEAAVEGINHDVAFAQMCLETGYLKYGGLVTPDMNNFCGLGAIGPSQPGERFPSPQIGVRAHIQHLKAYATDEPLQGDLVDPRYRYVRYGSSPTLNGLAGTWATDREYAHKIRSILARLYNFSLTVESVREENSTASLFK